MGMDGMCRYGMRCVGMGSNGIECVGMEWEV
jgi:hypothetical protein